MGIVTYHVQIRHMGTTTWIPWGCYPEAEEALKEMRRCSGGFDAKVTRSDGTQLAAIIGGRRGYVSADRVAGVPAERAR